MWSRENVSHLRVVVYGASKRAFERRLYVGDLALDCLKLVQPAMLGKCIRDPLACDIVMGVFAPFFCLLVSFLELGGVVDHLFDFGIC
jgi:hypothetical protein